MWYQGEKSPETIALREKVMEGCEQIIWDFFDSGGQVVIYDANNGTRVRRNAIAEKFDKAGIHVVMLGTSYILGSDLYVLECIGLFSMFFEIFPLERELSRHPAVRAGDRSVEGLKMGASTFLCSRDGLSFEVLS